eukprot:SAG31_NODE_775_length_12190_cov_5.764866_2_plen_100_part_00
MDASHTQKTEHDAAAPLPSGMLSQPEISCLVTSLPSARENRFVRDATVGGGDVLKVPTNESAIYAACGVFRSRQGIPCICVCGRGDILWHISKHVFVRR